MEHIVLGERMIMEARNPAGRLRQDDCQNTAGPMVKAQEIASPIKGNVLRLEDLQDAVFASGVLEKRA